MKRRFAILILILLLFTACASAQSKIEYSYDFNGNRTSRKLTVEKLKSTEINKTESLIEDDLSMENTNKKCINVFPNPVKNSLNIQIVGYDDNLKKEATVYSLSGNKLKQENKLSVEGNIDMGDLDDGVYLLRILVGDEIFHYKIIKSK